MPQIAQQDYIYFPILGESGELPAELSQEIQNQIFGICRRGGWRDITFTNKLNDVAVSPVGMSIAGSEILLTCWNDADGEWGVIRVQYREITNEPDAQEGHLNDAQ